MRTALIFLMVFSVCCRVAGGELQRVIDIHDGLEEVQAVHVLQQILKGLSFLHSYKIAHLDLKVTTKFLYLYYLYLPLKGTSFLGLTFPTKKYRTVL